MSAPRAPLTIGLRDGSQVAVRPIRPDDKERLRRSFERLSEESRFRRFLTPMNRLDDATLHYLTEVDHHGHEALLALDPTSGDAVGVARFVRTGPGVAEVAVTVADDWHERGMGTALLELLAVRAREEGIARFSGLILASNREMLELMRRLGPASVVERGSGAVEAAVDLPEDGVGPHVKELLRMAGRGDATVARPGARPASAG